MLKIRKELDNLLDNDKLHFGIDDNKRLCIKNKCGKTIVTFYDVRFSNNIPNSEIEYVKKLLINKIDEINEKLNKIEKLRDELSKINLTFKVGTYYDDGMYKTKLYKGNSEIKLSEDDTKIVAYRIEFENLEEAKKLKEQFDKYFQQYKKWKKILTKVNELEQEINNCEI